MKNILKKRIARKTIPKVFYKKKEKMRLTIVYDNEIFMQGIGLHSDWGFACQIKTSRDTVLFDTGANGEILLSNMEKLHLSTYEIKKIVISHEHKDHNGGLSFLSPFLTNSEVYRLKSDKPHKFFRSIYVEKPQKICENIWTTGRLKGPVDEQALVLKGRNGWYILTGCSHPGVETILNSGQKVGPIVGIIGGFHGFHSFSVLNELECVCPCHCTRYKHEIKKRYPQSYTSCGVGQIIEI
jgi:7,8-dihydropterin-6-yl-methyl-4-(beta-D-ribofuranosyl)aminobenzene 5'-phosphate synthase